MDKLHRAAEYYVQQEVKGMIDCDINTNDIYAVIGCEAFVNRVKVKIYKEE